MNLEESQARIRELEEQVAIMAQQIDYLKRQLFGRKSEKLDHPELFGEDVPGKDESSDGAEEPAEDNESGGEAKAMSEGRRRAIRKDRLPDNLPVRSEEVVPAYVQADPEAWRDAGVEERFQLEKEPGYFYLRRLLYR